MKAVIKRGELSGTAEIPASKSHTIRAVFAASLSSGKSEIIAPLQSRDTEACIAAWKKLGAEITAVPRGLLIQGTGGNITAPDDIIDAGNSGTTLFFALSAAGLGSGWSFFTGDSQIRRRSAENLLASLNDLGASSFSSRGNGCAPFAVRGPFKGGVTEIKCPTSQYLSSLLMSLPAAEKDSAVTVPLLNEKPYVEMTLQWLKDTGIHIRHNELKEFSISGGQNYSPFKKKIPGDFSSASFFLCGAAVTGSAVKLHNLDPQDTQGDREILSILTNMGASWKPVPDGIAVTPGSLSGNTFDLNDMPDALPILAVTACFARGETRLINVPQAREKETDRIAVMAAELGKMGADIQELPDGLVIRESPLRGTFLDGHGDHRVVMALSIAGLGAEGETVIDTAETAAVTFPDFFSILSGLAGEEKVRLE